MRANLGLWFDRFSTERAFASVVWPDQDDQPANWPKQDRQKHSGSDAVLCLTDDGSDNQVDRNPDKQKFHTV